MPGRGPNRGEVLGLAGHRQGDVLHRERELLDHYECQYLGMDTPGWRHQRSRGWFRRFFGSALGALVGDFIAAISVFVNFTFIPSAPWWALTIIFIDLWVIHPLFVHRRLRD